MVADHLKQDNQPSLRALMKDQLIDIKISSIEEVDEGCESSMRNTDYEAI